MWDKWVGGWVGQLSLRIIQNVKFYAFCRLWCFPKGLAILVQGSNKKQRLSEIANSEYIHDKMLTCMSSTILFLLPSLCLSAVIHKTSMSVESTGGVHKWMESEEHGTNEHDLVSVEVGGGAVSHSSDDGKYAEAVGGDSAGELPPGAPRLPPGATDYRDGRTYKQVVVNDPRDEVPPNEKQRPHKKQGLPYPPLPDGAVDHRDGRTYKQVVVDDKRGAPTGAPATKRRAEPEPKSKS